MSAPRPPRLAVVIARLLAGREEAQFLLNDLAEEFEQFAQEEGRSSADRWYRRQVLRSAPPLARARARSAFGVLRRINLRYALRLLRRSPGLSLAVILTLALGIGANTAIFSVIDAVLLRPLAYPEPDRLVAVWERTPDRARQSVAAPDYADYTVESHSFDAIAAYRSVSMTLDRRDIPEVLTGEMVSAAYLPMLGARASIGRTFDVADDRSGADATVVLSDTLWRTRFGADPAVVGQSISLSGEIYQVRGVLAADFTSLSELTTKRPAAFFVASRDNPADGSRADHELFVVGRLRAGATVETARRELVAIAAVNARKYPDTNGRVGVFVTGLRDDVVAGIRPSLLIISGAVALVVMIACVNVANLLLVWMSGRRKELAVRLAIGATGADIIADCLTRGLVLAALGGLGGMVVGSWTRDLLVSRAPASIPRLTGLSLDARVLAVAAAVTLTAGIVAGLVPALPFLRRRGPSLRSAQSSAVGDRAAYRMRGLLLMFEVAAAVVLALGAGLLVRSLVRLNDIDLGFRTNGVITMNITPSPERYPDAAARLRDFDTLQDRLSAVSGVDSVAYANQFPLRGGWSGGVTIEGPAGPIAGEAELQAVSAGYFSTFDIGLVRGRVFEPADQAATLPVVVISETFARQYAAGRDPIGLRVRRGPTDPLLTVVGVVRGIRRDGKLETAEPQMYFCARQIALYRSELEAVAIRSNVDAAALVPTIRRIINEVEPGQLVTRLTTLDMVVNASVAPRRFNSWLLTAFALLSVMLAVVGVYGVVAHIVSERTREMGLRLALGATRAHVIGLVVLGGVRWAAFGVVVGLAAAFGLSRLLSSMLFEITATDPVTFVGVPVLMLAVSAIASFIPARRAADADPLAALRAD